MKQIVCEMCGGNDFLKEDGLFVCQSCTTKYSVAEARKMMIEGVVNVTGSTIKVDSSDELKNLYQIARRAKDNDNGEDASRYYDRILMKDSTSWEAAFYTVYFKAMECKIAEIESAAIRINNNVSTVLALVKEFAGGVEEQEEAVREITIRCINASNQLHNAAVSFYNGIDAEIRLKYDQEMVNNRFATTQILYNLGDNIALNFGDVEAFHVLLISAWNQGVERHTNLIPHLSNKEANKKIIMSYVEKIQLYDTSYETPEIKTSGCYIATAVYGSYDCPEVWTLRRYRDYELAKTLGGRAIIKIYYRISPSFVKWFGQTDWFTKLWKALLDRLVERLHEEGVTDTPYEDINWEQ